MPNLFNRIAPGSSSDDIIRTTNDNFAKIDNESVTKTFSGANGTNAIVQGRLGENQYGLLFSDQDGVPRILLGQAPTGDVGFWISNTGVDVTTLFS